MVMMVAPTAGRRTMRKSRIRAGRGWGAGAAAIASMCSDRGVAGTSKPCGLMNADRRTLTRRVRVGEQCHKLIQMRVEIAGQVQQPPRRASS